jgi:hypothetical protein
VRLTLDGPGTPCQASLVVAAITHLCGGFAESVTFPEGVIVSIKDIITTGYIAALVAILVWFPLVAIHGYRQWWVVTFYAVAAAAMIGGDITRIVARNRKS